MVQLPVVGNFRISLPRITTFGYGEFNVFVLNILPLIEDDKAEFSGSFN